MYHYLFIMWSIVSFLKIYFAIKNNAAQFLPYFTVFNLFFFSWLSMVLSEYFTTHTFIHTPLPISSLSGTYKYSLCYIEQYNFLFAWFPVSGIYSLP